MSRRAIDSELAAAIQRYRLAAKPGLSYSGIEWPELIEVLAKFNFVKGISNSLAVDSITASFLAQIKRALRILRMSPLHPADPLVGIAVKGYSPGTHVDGDLGRAIENLQESLSELVTQPHPGYVEFSRILTGESKMKFDPARSICVVTSGQLAKHVAHQFVSLQSDERSIDVLTKSEARFSKHYDLCVIFGSPENLVDWRIDRHERPREISWLFTSPLAANTLVLSWPGNVAFDPGQYEPYEGAGMFDPRVMGSRQFTIDIPDEEAVTVRSRPSVHHVPGEEAFDCIDFALPGDSWISFGLEVGHRATKILDDEFGVEFEEGLRPQELRRGDVLVVAEGGGSHAKRKALCFEWVDSHRGFSGERAMASVQLYRSALRAKHGDETFLRTLVKRGFSEEYARGQLLRAWSESAMAPQRQGNFNVIVDALGLEFDKEEAWEHIRGLRSGFMAAGSQIVDWLKQAIVGDQSWLAAVEDREIAIVDVPDLGRVQLAPILAVAPDVVQRPLSRLGEIWK